MSAPRACVREISASVPHPERLAHRFVRVHDERVCRDCGYVGECFDPTCSCAPCDRARKNEARRRYYTERSLIRELRRKGTPASWDISVDCELCGAKAGYPCNDHCASVAAWGRS